MDHLVSSLPPQASLNRPTALPCPHLSGGVGPNCQCNPGHLGAVTPVPGGYEVTCAGMVRGCVGAWVRGWVYHAHGLPYNLSLLKFFSDTLSSQHFWRKPQHWLRLQPGLRGHCHANKHVAALPVDLPACVGWIWGC
jgi:hypothetical protein